FAVAAIGNAFAPAAEAALRKFRHHYLGFGLGATADGKMSRDGPGFDRDFEPLGGGVNHVLKALLTSLDSRVRSVKYVTEMRFFSRCGTGGRADGCPEASGAVRGFRDGEWDEF